MKNYRNTLAMILSIVLCVCLLALPVMAQTTNSNGLEVTLTSDKTEYAAGDDIVATLTVKNTTEETFENLHLEHLAPGSYGVAAGEASKTVDALAPGESVSITVTYGVKAPATGDFGITMVIGVMIMAAVALFVLMVANKKARMVSISVFLCCVMIAGVTPVHAAELGETISVSTDVTVDGSKLTLKAQVSGVPSEDPPVVEQEVYLGMTAAELDALACSEAGEFADYMNVRWNFAWDGNPVADKVDFTQNAGADSKIWKIGIVGNSAFGDAGWGVQMAPTGVGSNAFMYTKLDIPAEGISQFRIWAALLKNETWSGNAAIRAVAVYKDADGNYVRETLVPINEAAQFYNEADGTVRISGNDWGVNGIPDGMMIYGLGNLAGKEDVVIFVEAIGIEDGITDHVIVKRIMFL